MANKRLDLAGKTFGLIEVIRFHSSASRNGQGKLTRWECRCRCGKELLLWGSRLKNGETLSCGCLQSAHFSESRTSNINRVIASYRRGAARRNLSYLLSEGQSLLLMEGVCYYCGGAPSMISYKANPNYPFIHNGIDRLDSRIGYVVENTVSCCTICNRSKSSMTRAEFLSWIGRVYEKHHGVEI